MRSRTRTSEVHNIFALTPVAQLALINLKLFVVVYSTDYPQNCMLIIKVSLCDPTARHSFIMALEFQNNIKNNSTVEFKSTTGLFCDE